MIYWAARGTTPSRRFLPWARVPRRGASTTRRLRSFENVRSSERSDSRGFGHPHVGEAMAAGRSLVHESAGLVCAGRPLRAASPSARNLPTGQLVWWDSGPRQRYGFVLGALAIALAVLATAVLKCLGCGVDALISALPTLAPAFLWSLRERTRQMSAASTLDRLCAKRVTFMMAS
jgi:hypothetical protein